MGFKFRHNNINVHNLEKSLDFYREALGLVEIKRRESADFTLVFLGDGKTDWSLELTCLTNHPHRYDLGENESHVCLSADNYDAAHDKHAAMGCICYENEDMGLYFIEDPDGYWIEIVPDGRG